jgi:hypothetical protein
MITSEYLIVQTKNTVDAHPPKYEWDPNDSNPPDLDSLCKTHPEPAQAFPVTSSVRYDWNLYATTTSSNKWRRWDWC